MSPNHFITSPFSIDIPEHLLDNCLNCDNYLKTGGCPFHEECSSNQHYTPTPIRALEKHIDAFPGSRMIAAIEIDTWLLRLRKLMSDVRERYRRD